MNLNQKALCNEMRMRIQAAFPYGALPAIDYDCYSLIQPSFKRVGNLMGIENEEGCNEIPQIDLNDDTPFANLVGGCLGHGSDSCNYGMLIWKVQWVVEIQCHPQGRQQTNRASCSIRQVQLCGHEVQLCGHDSIRIEGAFRARDCILVAIPWISLPDTSH